MSREDWLALAREMAESAISKLRRERLTADDLAEIEGQLRTASEHCKDAMRSTSTR